MCGGEGVVIAIVTYRRPLDLAHAVGPVASQAMNGEASVLVVDNDPTADRDGSDRV